MNSIEELRAAIRWDLYQLSGGNVMYLFDNAAPQPVPCLGGPEVGSKTGGNPQAVVAAPSDTEFLQYLWKQIPQTMQGWWEQFLEDRS